MKKTLILISLIFSIAPLFSQKGSVRGFVYEKKNGEPVMFTNVYLQGTNFGASTDINGYYSITRIPVGKYTLMVTSIGYDTTQVNITVEANKTLENNLTLSEASVQLDEFIISAERQEMKSQVYTSLVKISPKQVNMIPSIGGERDIAQFLQVVPGVVFTGDQGGQLYIRGGAPIHNKVLLDGMVVYNPFHSIGIFSVFDTDIIRNTDVYTGGFNAEYGGRISSIMDFTTKDGNRKDFNGKVSVNPFASKILLEGPIVKMTDDNYSSISYLLSAKKSYIDWASQNLYKHLDTLRLPFEFTDIYGKLSINGRSGNKLNLFGFSFNDNVTNYQGLADYNWNAGGGGASLILVPSGTSTMINMGVNYSFYSIGMSGLDDLPRSSSIGNLGFNFSLQYFLGESEFKYGVELLNVQTKYSHTSRFNYELVMDQRTSEIAAYAKYKLVWGNLIFDPGIRFTNYTSLSENVLEPRAGLKWSITETLRFKASGGLYSQNLIAANSDRDVVNLFSGFLSAPENELFYQDKPIKSNLQKSKHIVAGFEFDFTNYFTANVEAYYKGFDQLIGINRLARYPNDLQHVDNVLYPNLLKNALIVEDGNAYGLDFLFKYNKDQVYLWFVYSMGFVNRTAEFIDLEFEQYEQTFPTHFDRRHTINLVASYTFGKGLLWEVSGRWNFGSGFPFTPNQGFYESITFPNIYEDYTTSQGYLQVLYGETNSKRLPTYHRFDINLKHTIHLGNKSELVFDVGATNAYNRDNVFYVHRIRNKTVNQLPIMPSIGMSITF
ncbi:MAG: carboxypeptidase-like regulatory domain-containing protein [Salinivirgaceae bacterium]|nr:carboxypeptidase-like regulatory domain-containing protein [Salinivirgaceae bacterium]